MLSRRCLCGSAVMAAGTALLPNVVFAASDLCEPFDAKKQQEITPEQAVQRLLEGNKRFTSGKQIVCSELALLGAAEAKQTPYACILGCIDSRAAPEIVFDQEIGDIFVARVAGNVPSKEIIGSFEYATKVAGAKAILVLGHSHCGAVKGAIDQAKVGDNLTALLAEIEPAVDQVLPKGGERSSKNEKLVEDVAVANVLAGVKRLTDASTVLRDLVTNGQLKIVGAIEELHTGKVTLLT